MGKWKREGGEERGRGCKIEREQRKGREENDNAIDRVVYLASCSHAASEVVYTVQANTLP